MRRAQLFLPSGSGEKLMSEAASSRERPDAFLAQMKILVGKFTFLQSGQKSLNGQGRYQVDPRTKWALDWRLQI